MHWQLRGGARVVHAAWWFELVHGAEGILITQMVFVLFGDNGAALWCFGRIRAAAAELYMILRCGIRLHCPTSEYHDNLQYLFVCLACCGKDRHYPSGSPLVSSRRSPYTFANAAAKPLGNVHSRAAYSLGKVHTRADHSLARSYSHASSRVHTRAPACIHARSHARASRTHASTFVPTCARDLAHARARARPHAPSRIHPTSQSGDDVCCSELLRL